MTRRSAVNLVTCTCGQTIAALGMAAHLRGNSHRCASRRVDVAIAGYTHTLPGTTCATIRALRARGYDVAAAPFWSAGGVRTPGYESACAAVRPIDALRLANDPRAPEAARRGARITAPRVASFGLEGVIS